MLALDFAGVFTGRDADNPLEVARQVALTAEADLDRHVDQRSTRLDQPLRLTNTHGFEIAVGRHPDLGMKYAHQIVRD